MGVCDSVSKDTKVEVNKDIAKILAKLDLKMDEYNETFKKNANETEEKQKEQLKQRHEKLVEWKKNNNITEENIKQLNKEELKVEIDMFSNQADKMHFIYDTGMELVEPIKKLTLDEYAEKVKKAPGIAANKLNQKIEEIKNMNDNDFLESTYGKCLKDALVKKGLSQTVLTSFKNELYKQRQERRENERKEFDIKENEFGNEFDKIELDLFKLIKSEFKFENVKKNFKEYSRDKLVDLVMG